MAEESGAEKKEKTGFDVKLIIVGVVFLLIATTASYFIMQSLLAPIMPKQEKKEGESKVGALLAVGEFTTNVNDVAGTRFIKVEVTVETDEKKKEEVNANMAVVKDTILNTFASKTAADLDIKNRENLKEEMRTQLNSKLGENVIKNVYFTKFIMQ